MTQDDGSAHKVVVFGATGPTGQRIVPRDLEKGYLIVAVARHYGAVQTGRPEVEAVSANVTDPHTDLDQLVKGSVAVLSALGSRERRPTTVYSAGAKRITEAMSRHASGHAVTVTERRARLVRGASPVHPARRRRCLGSPAGTVSSRLYPICLAPVRMGDETMTSEPAFPADGKIML
jgi:hypothetical protein